MTASTARRAEDEQVGPKVAAMLVSHRRPAETERALARIAAQTLPVVLLIVVNVEADPETEGVVAGWSARWPEVEYLPVAENVGPAGAISLGLPELLRRCPEAGYFALFEEDDPPARQDSVERLVDHLERQPAGARVGVAGYHGALLRRGGAVLIRPAVAAGGGADVDYVSGNSCPIVRRELLEEIGSYDADLFFGFEELEFGLRARAAGWRLHIIDGWSRESGPRPDSSAASWSIAQWSWRRYYSLRNLIVILLRRKSRLTALRVALGRGLLKPLAWLPLRPGLAMRHLRHNSAAIRDAWSGRLGLTLPPADEQATPWRS